MKLIMTASGAKYIVAPDGSLTRPETDVELFFTRGGKQYTQGFLVESETYEGLRVGWRFRWMGTHDDFGEVIWSTNIVSIEEDTE